MTNFKRKGFLYKSYSWSPLIILYISVLNEFDLNYLNLDYFSFNFLFILFFFFFFIYFLFSFICKKNNRLIKPIIITNLNDPVINILLLIELSFVTLSLEELII